MGILQAHVRKLLSRLLLNRRDSFLDKKSPVVEALMHSNGFTFPYTLDRYQSNAVCRTAPWRKTRCFTADSTSFRRAVSNGKRSSLTISQERDEPFAKNRVTVQVDSSCISPGNMAEDISQYDHRENLVNLTQLQKELVIDTPTGCASDNAPPIVENDLRTPPISVRAQRVSYDYIEDCMTRLRRIVYD